MTEDQATGPEPSRDGTSLLEAEGICKAYPGVQANDGVSLRVREGEVHALLGENGAGKSTLVKIVYGLVRPDSGSMTMRGQPYAPTEPRAARGAGVALVFQHFSLFNALSVAENIALGMEAPPPRATLAERIREVSEGYRLALDPFSTVGDLSAGERQRVEIVRCLLQEPKLLIMDEPTSVLTPQEVEALFGTLRKLSSEGTAILYISHKLEEIRSLCSAATVLRRGKVAGICDPSEKSAPELAEMMVGQELQPPQRTERAVGDPALEVRGLNLQSRTPFGTSLKEVGFEVRSGEILGIGGVAGNGQDELMGALSGETPVAADTVRAKGAPVGDLEPNGRRRLGLLAAPEERLGHAAAPDMSLTENALMTGTIRRSLAKWGFLDWPAARGFAEEVIGRFDVRTPGPEAAARSLSGGNLQKFVMGREILQDPDVLVVSQPTWGLDASAAAAIRQSLIDLAERGAAVVVVSQDLDELMEISDRFAALCEGRLSEAHPTREMTVERIGLLMGGAAGGEAGDAAA